MVFAVVVGLLAGILGGWVGYQLNSASRSDLDPDVSLETAPVDVNEREAGSVAQVSSEVLPTVVSIGVRGSGRGASGSGFVIRSDGYVLTNNHVVASAADGGQIEVSFAGGETSEARIVGRSQAYDLAVLKVNRRELPTSRLGNSDSLVVGDPVIAIGSPLGLSGTVTTGIVSALNRPVTAGDANGDLSYISAVQTDAAINPGNSGGPLVDANGRVVGVNSSIATLSSGGVSGNIGLGFAIPINQARSIAEQLIATGVANYPLVGVNLDITYNGQGARILPFTEGDRVPITPGGPADDAGLQAGDVVVAVDGDPVANLDEFVVAVRVRLPGDVITLTVERDGERQDFDVVLGSTEG